VSLEKDITEIKREIDENGEGKYIPLTPELSDIFARHLNNQQEILFKTAMDNPEYIDVEKAKTGKYVFPYTRKFFDDMAQHMYKAMEDAGIDPEIINGTRYANEKTDRFMLPDGKQPTGISRTEFKEWQYLYKEGIRRYRNGIRDFK
jgi:Txe/YoeB family toxin of Txe-Axe toxin-antitoxin module